MANEKDRNEGKIYIRKITKDVTEKMVRDHFTQYGEVAAVDIMRGRFGFVTFSNPSVVNTVLQNEHTINGKLMLVQQALLREQNTSCGASMADTRSSEDKIAEQWVSASSAATTMGVGVVSAASMDQPPSGTSTALVSAASIDQPPIGTSTAVVSAASMDQPRIGYFGHQSCSNNTGTSDATWRTESSQGAAGYEAIGQGNVATLPDSRIRGTSSGGGGSAPIAPPRSLWPPHVQYERQSFATNFDRHGTSGGGSQGIYGWQASTSTLDGNTSVPQQQATAAHYHYPQRYFGYMDYLSAYIERRQSRYTIPSIQSAPLGQPPIRSNMYGRQDFISTNSGGGASSSWGVQHGSIMEPLDPNAVLMSPSEAAEYGYVGEMDHNLMDK